MIKRTPEEQYKEFITKRHLGELTNEDDIKIIKRIFDEHMGSLWLYPQGPTLLSTNPNIDDAQVLQTRYLATIVEQNFIMIRQLERISRAVGGEPEPKKPSKMEEYLKKKQEAVRNEK